MNYLELQDEIILLVDSGTSEIDALVPGLVNDAVFAIANEPGVILPSLKSIVSVNTVAAQGYTSIPVGYDSKVIYASVGGLEVETYNTIEDLLKEGYDFSTEGEIEALAVEGNVLWYANTPADVTAITMLLYKNPVTLVEDTDVPEEIPVHLHRSLIIPYVAKTMFDMIEQEDDTTKTQTQVQELFYEKGLVKLREYLAARRRGMSRSIWNI